MRLWKKAYAALKDRNSILIASVSRKTNSRNPDIERAVIKATNHDELSFDSKNVERIYKWIRLSSTQLKPVLSALSSRVEKTHSWVVALKGLMLLHGILACNVPEVRKIGRFPFDLSNFKDGYSKAGKSWGYNNLIRSYYTFLDQKSTLFNANVFDRRRDTDEDYQENVSLRQDLVLLQKLQGLLDMLLQIRPLSDAVVVPLVLEAMKCIAVEVFDAYGRISSGISKILLRIYSAGKVEAAIALGIVQKAIIQGEELALYFDICRQLGVMRASECPEIQRIPEEDILELEHIINGSPVKSDANRQCQRQEEDKAIVVVTKDIVERKPRESQSELRTIITQNWETFDEDMKNTSAERSLVALGRVPSKGRSYPDYLTPSPVKIDGKKDELPDLIIL